MLVPIAIVERIEGVIRYGGIGHSAAWILPSFYHVWSSPQNRI